MMSVDNTSTLPPDLIQDALLQFWQQGYQATSLSALANKHEMKVSSLSRLSKGKKGLYLIAMDAYFQEHLVPWIESLSQFDSSRDHLFYLFGQWQQKSAQAPHAHGCFLCNALLEIPASQTSVYPELLKYQEKLHKAFVFALRQSRSRDDLDMPTDPTVLADFVMCLYQGLSVSIRSGVDKKVLSNQILTGLSALSCEEGE